MPNSSQLSPQRLSSAPSSWQQLTKILTTPYAIAAFVSIGFHVVVFAVVARSSPAAFAAFGEDNTSNEERTVPLVTLSPSEQGRLPDFNRPQLPSIPDITSGTSLGALPNSTIFNRSGSRIISPSNRSASRFNRNRLSRTPYIPKPNYSIANTPSRSAQSSERRTTIITDIPNPPPDIETGLSDEEIKKRRLEIEAQQAAAEQETPATPDTEEGPGLSELPDPADEPTAPEDPIAANPEPDTQVSRLEQLQATSKFQHNPDNTDPDLLEDNYTSWETATNDANEIAIQTSEEKGTLPVGEGFNFLCNQKPPQNGEVGILVAPDGTPIDAEILLSTGYDAINQDAKDTLVNKDTTEYPATETAMRYRVEITVEFDAETCTSEEQIRDVSPAS